MILKRLKIVSDLKNENIIDIPLFINKIPFFGNQRFKDDLWLRLWVTAMFSIVDASCFQLPLKIIIVIISNLQAVLVV